MAETASAAGNPTRARLIRVLALGEAGVIAALITLAFLFWMFEPAFLSERNLRARPVNSVSNWIFSRGALDPIACRQPPACNASTSGWTPGKSWTPCS